MCKMAATTFYIQATLDHGNTNTSEIAKKGLENSKKYIFPFVFLRSVCHP